MVDKPRTNDEHPNESQKEQKSPVSSVIEALYTWLPAILWSGLLFYLSTDAGSNQDTKGLLFRILSFIYPGVYTLSPASQDLLIFIIRKAAHLTEYCILSLLLLRAFTRSGVPFPRAVIWTAVIFSSYAVMDEVHQSFVPSRTPAPMDVGFDIAGGIIGIALFKRVK